MVKQTEQKQTLGIRPLSGYVLVEPSNAETTTESGIVLPETAQEKPAYAKVLAIGPAIYLGNGVEVRCPVNIGDVVVFEKWAGKEIKVHGKEYKLVKFEDLIGVVEGNNKLGTERLSY